MVAKGLTVREAATRLKVGKTAPVRGAAPASRPTLIEVGRVAVRVFRNCSSLAYNQITFLQRPRFGVAAVHP